MAAAVPILAVSLGDPAGVGPEVVAKALKDPAIRASARFLLCGHPASVPDWLRPSRSSHAWLAVEGRPWRMGRSSTASGSIAALSVTTAAKAVLAGLADGLVTAPLSKEALRLSGSGYTGHTELLARLAGLEPDEVGMMLCGGGIRVFLVTRHRSLRSALKSLNRAMLAKAIRLAVKGLRRDLGIPKPRLAVAAVNPHAGEAGAFGREELDILEPVVRSFRGRGAALVSGPYPADTVFYRARQGAFDAVICPFHDQGLIPLKLVAFDSGVNVTLGLPFVRTSPDHGTAFDIAGKGKADPSSFKAAVRMALEMIRTRSRSVSRAS